MAWWDDLDNIMRVAGSYGGFFLVFLTIWRHVSTRPKLEIQAIRAGGRPTRSELDGLQYVDVNDNPIVRTWLHFTIHVDVRNVGRASSPRVAVVACNGAGGLGGSTSPTARLKTLLAADPAHEFSIDATRLVGDAPKLELSFDVWAIGDSGRAVGQEIIVSIEHDIISLREGMPLLRGAWSVNIARLKTKIHADRLRRHGHANLGDSRNFAFHEAIRARRRLVTGKHDL